MSPGGTTHPRGTSVGVRLTPEVWEALRGRRAVVGLETSVFAQGLPAQANREAANAMLRAVHAAGAVPALTAVVGGEPAVGLTPSELERFLAPVNARKVSARDLAATIARGEDGATTVAAALALIARVGVDVLVTGGIGGVHRDAPYDESADLAELARQPCVVVCSGAKAILDLGATAERLETLGVPVVGFRTSEFPGFYCARSGFDVPCRAETPEGIAAIVRAHRSLGRTESVVVVHAPPADVALAADDVARAVDRALAEARASGIRGPATTPFLLAAVERATHGRSQRTNLALLEANAALAAQIAVCLTS
jgi:pseudouridine-5'-phosphate glycosidase